MVYVGYALPHTYVNGVMKSAFNGLNVFNPAQVAEHVISIPALPSPITENLFSIGEAYANLMSPTVLIGVFGVASVKTFK
jgi:hypothetical protein